MKNVFYTIGFLAAICGMCLIIYATETHAQQEERKAELAAAPVESTATYDVSALPAHNETENQIRMTYGAFYDEGIIQTSDGSLWELNTEEIDPYQPLLIWFDTNGTASRIEDDSIINVWRQIYN